MAITITKGAKIWFAVLMLNVLLLGTQSGKIISRVEGAIENVKFTHYLREKSLTEEKYSVVFIISNSICDSNLYSAYRLFESNCNYSSLIINSNLKKQSLPIQKFIYLCNNQNIPYYIDNTNKLNEINPGQGYGHLLICRKGKVKSNFKITHSQIDEISYQINKKILKN